MQLHYRTQGFNGTAVKYSPFFDNRLAVSSAANFGLIGNGRLYVLDLTENGIVPVKWFTTKDALYDTSWSEIHQNQLLAASGDGSIKLFDTGADEFPIMNWKEHNREVFCVKWNGVAKDRFCSSSWDGTVRIWTPHRQESLLTLPTHSCTYSAAFPVDDPNLVSCVTSDSYIRIFDLRTPASASNHLVLQIPNHSGPAPPPMPGQAGVPPGGVAQPAEILSHDWNKYRRTMIATAGVDRAVRTFDIRAPQHGPVSIMLGHDYAIKKVVWSPHVAELLVTASYDMTCRVWSDRFEEVYKTDNLDPKAYGPAPIVGTELGRMRRHTEFATGIDWAMFGDEGWCASVGWDENLYVWDVRETIS